MYQREDYVPYQYHKHSQWGVCRYAPGYYSCSNYYSCLSCIGSITCCLTVISTVDRCTVTLELPLGVKSSARASVLARVALTWTLEKNNRAGFACLISWKMSPIFVRVLFQQPMFEQIQESARQRLSFIK